ncbi:hypothetical protein GQX74_010726 [Glossina fuscipes]|nr:hypothetical protein GQX74_010726 [Glossina fuscipes]
MFDGQPPFLESFIDPWTFVTRRKPKQEQEPYTKKLKSKKKLTPYNIPNPTTRLNGSLPHCTLCQQKFPTLDVLAIIPCDHVFYKKSINTCTTPSRKCPPWNRMCKPNKLKPYNLTELSLFAILFFDIDLRSE